MVWMKDDMKFVKKKPKSFKAVYEDNPKGPTALKHPLMPWPPGTAKGVQGPKAGPYEEGQ